MSQLPPTDQPQVANSTTPSILTGEELSRYLNQPSEPILGKKRGLNGRLAHQFDNGKALRTGRSHLNAPALELTAMYDLFIRTRQKRVLQGMEPARVEPRPTSAPITARIAPQIRSSTAAPQHESTFLVPKQPVLPNREEPATAAPVTAGPSAAGPSTAIPSTASPSTTGPSTAGPSTGLSSDEQVIHTVKVVYAHFHGLNTLMNDEDASALWTNMSDGERAQVFEYHRHTCAEPVGPEVRAQVGNTPQPFDPLQQQPPPPPPPPTTEMAVIPHTDQAGVLPTLASGALAAGPFNEQAEECIINAIKVMHVRHHKASTFMSNKDAWALWTKWGIDERQELLVGYEGVCAETQLASDPSAQNGDHQAVHPVQQQDLHEYAQHQAHHPLHGAAHVPMVVEARPPSPARHLSEEHHDRPHTLVQQQTALHQPTEGRPLSRPPSALQVHAGAPLHVPPQYNHPPPEDRQPTLVQQQTTFLPPFEHVGGRPLSHPPAVLQAHTGTLLHLPPQYNPPQHHVSGLTYQASPPQGQQVIHSQHPSQPPTVVPIRSPADGDAPYRVGNGYSPAAPPPPPPQRQFPHQHREVRRLPRLPPRPPSALQVNAGAPPHVSPQYNHQHHARYQAGPPQAQQATHLLRPSRPPTVVPIRPPADGYPPYGVSYPGLAPPQQQFQHDQSYSALRSSLPQVAPQYQESRLQDSVTQPQPPLNYQSPATLGYPPRPPHETGNPPQFFQTELLWSHPTQGGSIIPSSHPHNNSTPEPPQSQLQFQQMSQDRPGLPPVGAAALTQMYHPIPSRPGPPPAYFREHTMSSQTTRTIDIDRLTEDTMTLHMMSNDDIEMWEDSGSFAGTADFCRKLDKGKSRATDTDVNFRREGPGDSLERETHRPGATSTGDTNVCLNQRPGRIDVPQFVNSDGTLLVINRLQGLSNAVQESIQAQKELSKEFKLFRELYQKSSVGLPLGDKRQVQPQTAQQRKFNDNSLRSRIREKRVDDKVRRLRGQSRYNGDEADHEADDEADNENDGDAELRELLAEKADFDRLKGRIRHSLTGFLGVYDWSTIADQYPTLTEQQLQDYKERKDSIVPTVEKNFRPDFHLPWKRHPFNKENREVFIDKYLARVEGGAYFKNPTPKEMLTRECIGFVLDNHMRYCRDRWRRSLRPLSPETLAQLAKSAAQRSRRNTLHQSRNVLVVRRGYTQHRLLMRLLDPCNMSGDETDGEEKTVDSKYRIIVSRWQSQELRDFLWAIDGYYRADWSHPTHRRAMGGNRPRQCVLRDGYIEDGIAPIGLWRNCYDEDWLKEQPKFVLRELEIVDEDYDFSFTTPVPTATASHA